MEDATPQSAISSCELKWRVMWRNPHPIGHWQLRVEVTCNVEEDPPTPISHWAVESWSVMCNVQEDPPPMNKNIILQCWHTDTRGSTSLFSMFVSFFVEWTYICLYWYIENCSDRRSTCCCARTRNVTCITEPCCKYLCFVASFTLHNVLKAAFGK